MVSASITSASMITSFPRPTIPFMSAIRSLKSAGSFNSIAGM